MRGLPGSGKSTLVKALSAKNEGETFIFSTDSYWLRPDGYYDFNYRRIGEAHAWNFKLCSDAFGLGLNYIVLDNTNTTLREFDQYIVQANRNDYEITIMEPKTQWAFDAVACHQKNTHNVQLNTIQKMLARWQDTNEVYDLLRNKYNIKASII